MRLFRTDLLPVLIIVAGGIIGASLSFGLLGGSPADVPVPEPIVASSAVAEDRASDQRQRQLAEDTEEATRRLERLARETDDPEVNQDLQDVARRLQRAAADMRRSTLEPAADQTGTVTGRVTDASSGSPVAAVQVYISSLELGGLSQRNGRYLLQNVPAGTYTLTVARIGYRSTEVPITIGGGQTVEHNFSVAEEALQLDPLVVPGTPGPVNIRGFSSIEIGNQPLIYVDGIRVDNSFGLGPGGSALDDINPNDIESIEIIKGPAAATLYGTEASAGVIQITLKKDRPQR